MAEEFEPGESVQPDAGVTADPAALHIALGQDTPEARAYLRQQTAVGARQVQWLDVQMETLESLKYLDLSHLRWRRLNDLAKGTLQILVALLGLLAFAGLMSAIWNATQADGIVVDEFSVPPAFAQNGVTGRVVADDLTARIAAVRDFANLNSISRSADVRQEGEEIKVEIPETGISLSQAWRYLKLLLGHERRLGGNLRRLPNGRVALSVTLDAEAFSQEGAADALGVLEQKAAEQVFARVDPGNTVLYLLGRGRFGELLAAAAQLHVIFAESSLPQRAESYALWAAMTHSIAGDPVLARQRADIAIGIDPRPAAPHMEKMEASADLGDDEAALAQGRIIGTLRNADEGPTLQGRGFAVIAERGEMMRLKLVGDYASAGLAPCRLECTFASQLLWRAEYQARLHDPSASEVLIEQALAGGAEADKTLRARYFRAMEKAQWSNAAATARAYAATLVGNSADYVPRLGLLLQHIRAQPLLAEALARGGDFQGAHAAIAATPRDCQPCLVTRGLIDGLEKKWGGADYWFRRAVAAGPSLPFAREAWGRVLLAKGDAAGAAEEFNQANRAGPHFADALEGWGEALMAQNRSDLALLKFSQAAALAPNWKRLHRQWALALGYVGRTGDATKQAAIANALE